tara:strand:+ start:36 stop:287 length:252 start_codon:yes stop_codon:yes gene_type:complete
MAMRAYYLAMRMAVAAGQSPVRVPAERMRRDYQKCGAGLILRRQQNSVDFLWKCQPGSDDKLPFVNHGNPIDTLIPRKSVRKL